jgi:hypothetical protein
MIARCSSSKPDTYRRIGRLHRPIAPHGAATAVPRPRADDRARKRRQREATQTNPPVYSLTSIHSAVNGRPTNVAQTKFIV